MPLKQNLSSAPIMQSSLICFLLFVALISYDQNELPDV